MEPEDFSSIYGVTITGELVELSKKTRLNSVYRSKLSDCTVVLDPKGMPSYRFGTRFDLGKTEFERCVIVAKGKIQAFTAIESVVFNECKFVGGPFTEAVFGSGSLASSKYNELLHHCDFTECDLRDARFYSTPIDQLKLPGWPNFSVVGRDGEQVYAAASKSLPGSTVLREQVLAFDWRDPKVGDMIEYMIMAVGNAPGLPTVVVHSADDIVKFKGVTLEEIKSELDRFGHPAVRY